jgi:hypothetical protein
MKNFFKAVILISNFILCMIVGAASIIVIAPISVYEVINSK